MNDKEFEILLGTVNELLYGRLKRITKKSRNGRCYVKRRLSAADIEECSSVGTEAILKQFRRNAEHEKYVVYVAKEDQRHSLSAFAKETATDSLIRATPKQNAFHQKMCDIVIMNKDQEMQKKFDKACVDGVQQGVLHVRKPIWPGVGGVAFNGPFSLRNSIYAANCIEKTFTLGNTVHELRPLNESGGVVIKEETQKTMSSINKSKRELDVAVSEGRDSEVATHGYEGRATASARDEIGSYIFTKEQLCELANAHGKYDIQEPRFCDYNMLKNGGEGGQPSLGVYTGPMFLHLLPVFPLCMLLNPDLHEEHFDGDGYITTQLDKAFEAAKKKLQEEEEKSQAADEPKKENELRKEQVHPGKAETGIQKVQREPRKTRQERKKEREDLERECEELARLLGEETQTTKKQGKSAASGKKQGEQRGQAQATERTEASGEAHQYSDLSPTVIKSPSPEKKGKGRRSMTVATSTSGASRKPDRRQTEMRKQEGGNMELSQLSVSKIAEISKDSGSPLKASGDNTSDVPQVKPSSMKTKHYIEAEKAVTTSQKIEAEAEEDEQYMSADEGASNVIGDKAGQQAPKLTCASEGTMYHTEEYPDSSGTHDIISDGANYRADDEPIVLPELPVEEEFKEVVSRSKRRMPSSVSKIHEKESSSRSGAADKAGKREVKSEGLVGRSSDERKEASAQMSPSSGEPTQSAVKRRTQKSQQQPVKLRSGAQHPVVRHETRREWYSRQSEHVTPPNRRGSQSSVGRNGKGRQHYTSQFPSITEANASSSPCTATTSSAPSYADVMKAQQSVPYADDRGKTVLPSTARQEGDAAFGLSKKYIGTGKPRPGKSRARGDQQAVEIVAAEQSGLCDGYTFLFDPDVACFEEVGETNDGGNRRSAQDKKCSNLLLTNIGGAITEVSRSRTLRPLRVTDALHKDTIQQAQFFWQEFCGGDAPPTKYEDIHGQARRS